MSISAPPPYAAMLRMFSGSRLRYEKNAWIACSSPIVPSVTSSWTRVHNGWTRYMNASMRTTPARRQPSIIPAASAVSSASGFSHSTCLPASAARQRPRRVQMVGQRDVHRLDVGVGEQLVVGAVVAARSPGRWPSPRHGRRRARRSPRPRTAPTAGWRGSPCARRSQRSRARRSAAGRSWRLQGRTATFSQRPPVGRPMTNDVANGDDERETRSPSPSIGLGGDGPA